VPFSLHARTIALLFLLAPVAAPLAARDLSWPRLEVDARLEADGSLSFSETQTMLFDGDWNGGERVFRLESGQRVEVDRMVRIDDDGEEHAMARGDLDVVDHWQWVSSGTLRWRARSPEDPPFAHTTRIYRIEGRYVGILLGSGPSYVLDHDFAFTNRDGVIDRLVVHLALDPAWRVADGTPLDFEAGPLPPGSGYVVRLDLDYVGNGEPGQATVHRLGWSWTLGGLALLWLFALWRWRVWSARDRAVGRFEPLPPPAAIDRAWLEEKIFSVPPEVVGAAWDRRVGPAEVAAMLARLVQQGKIESSIERRKHWFGGEDVMTMRLKVPRESFSSEEAPLIAGMFPLGDEIDSEQLRKHYRNRGFDPASKIRAGLERDVKRLRGFNHPIPSPRAKPTLLLVLAALLLFAVGFVLTRDASAIGIVGGLLVMAAPVLVLAGVARSWLTAVVVPVAGIAFELLLASAAIAGAATVPAFPLAGLGGAILLQAALVRSMFNLLATREGPETLARRREMLAARNFLRAELERARPNLEDSWFPWLVAFGLAPQVDRWCSSFGSAITGEIGGMSTMGGSHSTAGGWSGGGGAFGGAGATASFAAAVSTMASGVSSGGSSSGGGGGGGGSSGGGGGGGW